MNIYRHIPDLVTLEREYSPSSCVGSIDGFIAAYAARSAAARLQSPGYQTIQYGTSSAESLDFFPASSARRDNPRPLLAYIHGGYWQELSKEDHSFPAGALHQRDFSYAALGYGLAPTASLDEMVDRCRRAIAWIHTHAVELSVEPRAIHVAGSSAGAHLAAMVGLTDWSSYGIAGNPVRFLTLLSGVFDLRPLVLTYVNDALRMTQDGALRNSPLLRVDTARSAFPPALLAFGANETTEFKRQSMEFSVALRRKGYEAECCEIADRNHFDLPFDIAAAATTLGQKMIEHQERAS